MKEIKSNILDFTKLERCDGSLVDNIAEKIRKRYVDYLIKIGRSNEKNIDWWVLEFVSRNTYMSSLFRNVCYLIMLKKRLKEGYIYDEIIVDSLPLKKVIKKNYDKYHFKVSYSGRSAIYISVRRIYSYCRVIVNYFKRWVFGWSTRIYQRKISLNENITLIDTFVLKNSFANGFYNDRYYSKLLEYVSSDEKEHIYYVPEYYGIKDYKKIFMDTRTAKQKFLLKEDYLKIKDYIFALLYSFRVRKINIKFEEFMGFNISFLIKEEILNNGFSSSSMCGLLNYKFAQRLKNSNIKIKKIINWFENQTIDHGFNSGFRWFYPEVNLIGYQGFPLENNYLSLYPTEQERICAVIPKEINVIGKAYINMAKEFCPDLQVKVAPAFRYSEVWNKRNYFPDKHKCSILVALPISIDESDEIIGTVLESAYLINIKNCIFKIKPHPTHDIKKISNKWSKKLPELFEFVDEDFNSCIEKSDILISGASAVCLETLAKGIPVIVIGNRLGITQLTIPRSISKDIWKLCYSVNDVIEAVKLYAKKDSKMVNMYKKIGREIRDNFFEPVTELGIRKFLSL
jgi:hypothetical protein